MNDLLKQRIGRLLDSLSDERGYQILDYIEFLDSKYAERSRPTGILAKITETVEDTMRAGKAADSGDQRHDGYHGQRRQGDEGARAAGQAVVDEAVKAAESAKTSEKALPVESRKPETAQATDHAVFLSGAKHS